MTQRQDTIVRTSSAPGSYKLDPSGRKELYDKIYVGFVKDVRDLSRMGRLRVWIPELSGRPEDESRWFSCSYCSPFAGATDPHLNKRGGKSMDETQMAYGFWMIPPDIDNEVIVAFINGDPQRGIWMGCLYQEFMNHSVPGNALNKSFQGTTCNINPPVVEYNKRDDGLAPPDPLRPRFEPLHEGLCNEGLYVDPERGPTDAGGRRESPSMIFGFKSPRGHQFYVDDGLHATENDTGWPGTGARKPLDLKKPKIKNNEIEKDSDANEYIRLRTRGGTQILVNDTTGYIYMNSKEGNSWLEISDEGIDVYTLKDLDIRVQENVNWRVDGDFNLEVKGKFNWRNIDDIRILAEKQIHIHNENITGPPSKGGSPLSGVFNGIGISGDAGDLLGGDFGDTLGGAVSSVSNAVSGTVSSAGASIAASASAAAGGAAKAVADAQKTLSSAKDALSSVASKATTLANQSIAQATAAASQITKGLTSSIPGAQTLVSDVKSAMGAIQSTSGLLGGSQLAGILTQVSGSSQSIIGSLAQQYAPISQTMQQLSGGLSSSIASGAGQIMSSFGAKSASGLVGSLTNQLQSKATNIFSTGLQGLPSVQNLTGILNTVPTNLVAKLNPTLADVVGDLPTSAKELSGSLNMTTAQVLDSVSTNIKSASEEISLSLSVSQDQLASAIIEAFSAAGVPNPDVLGKALAGAGIVPSVGALAGLPKEGIFIYTAKDYNLTADTDIKINAKMLYHETAGVEINEWAPIIHNNSKASIIPTMPFRLNPKNREDRKIQKCCYPEKQIDAKSIIEQRNIVTHEPWKYHPKKPINLVQPSLEKQYTLEGTKGKIIKDCSRSSSTSTGSGASVPTADPVTPKKDGPFIQNIPVPGRPAGSYNLENGVASLVERFKDISPFEHYGNAADIISWDADGNLASPELMRPSEQLVQSIKKQFPFTSVPKLDAFGNYFIGYGQQIKNPSSEVLQLAREFPITEEEATGILKKEIAKASDSINKLLTVPLTQDQFDALTSMAFNMTPEQFEKTEVPAKMNSGDTVAAAAEVECYSSVDGPNGPVSPPGVKAARTAEANKLRDTPNKNGKGSKTLGSTKSTPTADSDNKTVKKAPPPLDNVLKTTLAAAEKHGADPYVMLAIANAESGGGRNKGVDPSAKKGASGTYQYMSATFAGNMVKYRDELGLQNIVSDADVDAWNSGNKTIRAELTDKWRPLRGDDALTAGMAALDTNMYKNTLISNGLEPNPENMYMYHFLGVGGGNKLLLHENPNKSFAEEFPNEAANNPAIAYRGWTKANQDTSQPRTINEVKTLMGNKITPVVNYYKTQY